MIGTAIVLFDAPSDCGDRNSQYGQLRAEELTRLRAGLSNLPASSQAPPIEQTVVLSRSYNGKWRRETYDRTDLPKEVDAVMKSVTKGGTIGAQ